MTGRREIFARLRKAHTLALLCIAVLVCGSGAASAQGRQITGSCVDFDLTQYVRTQKNPYGEGRRAMALYDGVSLYGDRNGGGARGSLNLGELVIIEEEGDYLGVRRLAQERDDLSYVRRSDLRCENRPLYSAETGLERKAVIKVGTVRSDVQKGRTVSAFRTPTLDDCTDTCRKLSRFELYFIFAETADALLLAREVRVATTANSPMVGWISKEDVYEWPYSVGLRVREDYTYGDGYGSACGYLSLAEAREANADKCQPILGGPSWFESSTRLLVMQQYPIVEGERVDRTEDVIYETVAPITSRDSEGLSVADGKLTSEVEGEGDYVVDPSSLRGADADVLLKNKRIDLFFLIDGTKSMLPHIDSIRGANGQDGLIQTMLNGLKIKIAQGIQFRAGFRVFRDTNRADRTSIGEGLPLPEQDCARMSREAYDANLEEFSRAIQSVDVTTDDKDDFSEDLYGGLAQALRDIRGCPDNLKLVFIITDAGYDQRAQQERGVKVPDVARLAERFNEEFRSGLIFFVRPRQDPSVTNPKYIAAWEDLIAEAQNLLPRLDIVRDLQTAKEKAQFFFQLRGDAADGAAIVGEINNLIIDPTAQPAAIDNLIIDIRGGASLQQAIERLRAENKDIPAYFWRLVERGACKDLGEACRNATYQSVTKVFVRNEPEKIALDVWMTDEQFKNWDNLLSRATNPDRSVAEQREAAVSSIDDAIRTIIREPPYDDENETFGEYLDRARVLPIGFRTPLLGYSLNDLIRPDKVSACELLSLITWLEASRQMLKIVALGDKLPSTSLAEGPPQCPHVTQAGSRIRNPTREIGEKKLEKGSLRFSASENTLSVPTYWIPQKYLP